MASLVSSGSPTFGSSRCALDTADRLQLPKDFLDETQGWLAFRVRMGFSASGGSAAPRLFEIADGANGDLQCGYDTGVDQWYMYRDTAGGWNQINTATQSFVSGDDVTVIVSWTATTISISFNGANFVVDSSAQHIPSLNGTFDLGNSPGANRSIESSFWWVAGGRGTLTNANAAAIHALGNTDPSGWPDFPSSPDFIWDAVGLPYTTLFPVTAVLDNFNRADGAGLGSNWTSDPEGYGYGTFDINTNQAKPNGTFPANYWNVTAFGADQEVFATLAVLPPGGGARLLARQTTPGVSGTEDNYEFEIGTAGGNSYISRTTNGARTTIKTTGVTFAAGDQVGLRCFGDQIIVFKNGVEIDRITDSTNTAGGYIAMVGQNDSGLRWDDFGGGNFTAGPLLSNKVATSVATRGADLTGTGTSTALLANKVATSIVVRGADLVMGGILLVGKLASSAAVRGATLTATGVATLLSGKVGTSVVVRGADLHMAIAPETGNTLTLGAEGSNTLSLGVESANTLTLNPE